MKKRKVDVRQVFIPTIGTVFTLAEDWTFPLYNEDRNDAMLCYQGKRDAVEKRNWRDGIKSVGDVTLPTGTALKVDRIYIRKGDEKMKEYDSVTFIVQSIPSVSIAVEMPKSPYSFAASKKPRIMRTIRFWAKLNDVNQMMIEAK